MASKPQLLNHEAVSHIVDLIRQMKALPKKELMSYEQVKQFLSLSPHKLDVRKVVARSLIIPVNASVPAKNRTYKVTPKGNVWLRAYDTLYRS